VGPIPPGCSSFSSQAQGGRWRGRRRSGRGAGRAPCCPTRRRSGRAGAPTAAATPAPRWGSIVTSPQLHTQSRPCQEDRLAALTTRLCTCDAGVQFLGSRADEGSSSSDEELAPSDDSEADDTGSPQPRSAKRTPAKRKLQVGGWSSARYPCCRMVHAGSVPFC
jgi:hypothetical protein